ncbi:hypothetical protein EBZ02_05200 [bacterium]|nr:hypothetical protein [bacterium]
MPAAARRPLFKLHRRKRGLAPAAHNLRFELRTAGAGKIQIPAIEIVLVPRAEKDPAARVGLEIHRQGVILPKGRPLQLRAADPTGLPVGRIEFGHGEECRLRPVRRSILFVPSPDTPGYAVPGDQRRAFVRNALAATRAHLAAVPKKGFPALQIPDGAGRLHLVSALAA